MFWQNHADLWNHLHDWWANVQQLGRRIQDRNLEVCHYDDYVKRFTGCSFRQKVTFLNVHTIKWKRIQILANFQKVSKVYTLILIMCRFLLSMPEHVQQVVFVSKEVKRCPRRLKTEIHLAYFAPASTRQRQVCYLNWPYEPLSYLDSAPLKKDSGKKVLRTQLSNKMDHKS